MPVLLVCFCLTGCKSVQELFQRKATPPPITNLTQPTLEELTSAINRNSQNIRNFTTENASILMPGVWTPLLSRITFERPKRMRIQGSVSTLSGQEFDFGSNDEIFWLWTRRGTNEMWHCRHELYPNSPVRSFIPIDPDWLIEALGIIEFKPTDQHYGPTRMKDGNWEIVSYCQTPSGQYIKRTVIDSKIGVVVRQELYNPQREWIALAESSNLDLDRGTSIYYAKKIEIQCQGMDGKMTINLGSPTFNTSIPLASSTFVMPVFEGYRAVDLSSPAFLQPHGVIMPTQTQRPTTTDPSVPQAIIQTVVR